MRADRKLIECNELRGLIDAALQMLDALELRYLGAHEAQHHYLPFWHETQRLEALLLVEREDRVDHVVAHALLAHLDLEPVGEEGEATLGDLVKDESERTPFESLRTKLGWTGNRAP